MNLFLDNVKKGKNNLWRYLLTIFLSWGLSSIIASILFIFTILFYIMHFGNFDINIILDSIVNFQSDPVFLFLLIFLSFSLSMIIFYICVKFIHKKDLISLVNVSKGKNIAGKRISWIKRIRWDRFLKGALLWSIFLIITEFILYIYNPNSFIFNFDIENIFLMILLFIIAIPIQVTFEELFFRGYLIQGLKLKIKNPIFIILFSSLVFSLGHIINGGYDSIFMIQNVVVTLIVGIMLCGFTLVDNGIELATGAHLANNFFAVIISSSDGSLGNFNSIIQTVGNDPIIDTLFTTSSLIVFALILFLYKKENVLKALNLGNN
ncbi:MAG: CPBP family intramembrane metalloprotease [Methanobacteriaceae archaeon]|jgi:membrane protease YdiL (CAAX protease family)|nr:CPBP family intramembrane metalloprotease [Candidatus Methanorudis spinitermitis]